MKRIIIASVTALTVVAAVLAVSVSAGASPGPVITFDDVNNVVTLQIPDPPCPASEPNCTWKFFLNEPKVSVDVSTIYGTSGTLTLAYPQNFCGIIQADAYVGPTASGPWTPQRGWQHQLPDSDCTPATTTTTSTTMPVPTSIPTPPSSPAAAPVTTTPTTLPATQDAADGTVATTPTTAPVVATPEAAASTLPFTGMNIMPFVLIGVSCVALGLGLLFGRRKRPL